MICGLLGRHLSHSYSPAIHKAYGEYSYELFDIAPEDLADFLKNGSFRGLNVTSPYKQAVIPYLDALSPLAQRLGAVNTIVRRADGSLIGHNTDYYGFLSTVERSGLALAGKKALILGSGGASGMGSAVLESLGAKVVTISRTGENNYTKLHQHTDAACIVNATPVGMYPDNGERLLQLDLFPRLEAVFDMIYNPARTQLLLDAQARDIPAYNGLWMLVAQAWESACWFTGRDIPASRIPFAYGKLRQQMENIILIGMPGCGKTTVGKALAEAMGRPFADLDMLVEELAGMPIPDIFAVHGEAFFRQLETKAATQIGKGSGLVIATGGGTLTREKNIPLLRQNGKIFWLQRQLQKLPCNGRPLSQAGSLAEMFKKRRHLYENAADFIVDNNEDISQTLSNIQKLWEENL